MRSTIWIAALGVLLAGASGARAQSAASADEVPLYTNADVEKLEPLPSGSIAAYEFDAEAWEFVEAFVTREREKILSDRKDALERELVEIEAERPVGYGERYPYDLLRVPYRRLAPLPRVVDDTDGAEPTPPTSIPHPIFQRHPPVREFTPGLGDSYRGPFRR